MAFGPKVSDPIDVIAVCVETAVDWNRSECGKLDYTETRDLSKLKVKEGQELTIFTIHPMPPAVLARATRKMYPESLMFAFMLGVRECSDKTLGLKWDYSGDVPVMKADSMEKLPANVWREIGHLIIQRESLTEGEEPRFSLPLG